MRIFALLFHLVCGLLLIPLASARTLEVGTDKQYTRLQQAAAVAQAGDTILLRAGVYSGGDFIANLQGSENAWISIRAATGESVIYRGGTQAFHLSNPAYLRIEGLVFEQQTGNGVNIDDGGSLNNPAHHVIMENCEWRSMNATGNNDELKLSGLDDFIIRNCRFTNGAAGGSLIDMVGCHKGEFKNNIFLNGGSNCIQAKGGTSNILIEGNRFTNGGERALNIGGSTGLEFFRPQGANYEAKAIEVYSNIFKGSTAPIAFVGAVECKVINNTIIRPTRWALRILQETVGSAFLPCGNNEFRNNIIVYGNTGTVAINVGGNTAPETFTFSNNLWFNPDNASWNGPNTPVTEAGRILNRNPLFTDTLDYKITPNSPAAGAGYASAQPQRDFFGNLFATPRSIGAVEANPPVTSREEEAENNSLVISPNPLRDMATVAIGHFSGEPLLLTLRDVVGKELLVIHQGMAEISTVQFSTDGLAAGVYILCAQSKQVRQSLCVVITK